MSAEPSVSVSIPAWDKMIGFGVRDFMTLSEAYVEFDDSNIINLCGYNDSGKSAMATALSILFYDGHSTDQVNFIQDDKDSSEIYAIFSTGVRISKTKLRTGKSLWTMTKGNETLFTNMSPSGVILAMPTVPDVISEYLNVVYDNVTGEYLNYRDSASRLFLVTTGGGDNYKIINAVLRCDVLAAASKNVNKDKNKKQAELSDLVLTNNTLIMEADRVQVLPDAWVSSISKKRENLKGSKMKMTILSDLNVKKSLLEDIEIPEELVLIDLERFNELSHLFTLKESAEEPTPLEVAEIDLSRYSALGELVVLSTSLAEPIPNHLEEVNLTRLSTLSDLQVLSGSLAEPIKPEASIIELGRLTALGELHTLQESLHSDIPPEVPQLDTARLADLQSLVESFRSLSSLNVSLDALEEESSAVTSQLSDLSNRYGYKICPSCGTVAV